jgi:hypothetical protein
MTDAPSGAKIPDSHCREGSGIEAMHDLILNEEQARVAAGSLHPLQVRDARGNVVGTFSPIWTEEDIAEAKRRLASHEPRYTTAQVLDYLKALKKS